MLRILLLVKKVTYQVYCWIDYPFRISIYIFSTIYLYKTINSNNYLFIRIQFRIKTCYPIWIIIAGAGFEPAALGLWAPRATRLLYPATKFLISIYYYSLYFFHCQVNVFFFWAIDFIFILNEINSLINGVNFLLLKVYLPCYTR